MESTGPAWDPKRAEREKKALEAREAARKHLQTTGGGQSAYELNVVKHGQAMADKIAEASKAAGDNTLEHLRHRSTQKRKAEEHVAEQQRLALEAMNAAKKRKADEAAAAEASLPQNWKSATTEKGKVYYWNTATKETSWQRPVAPSEDAQRPPPPPPPSEQQQQPKSSVPTTPAADSALSATAATAAAAAMKGATALPPLPAGWKSVRHAATGQELFVHEETKERRRKRPVEGDPTLPAARK